MAIEDDILSLLGRESGLKGREVAQRLGVEKTIVNSTLMRLKARRVVSQNAGYRWSLVRAGESQAPARREVADTPLARLCRYYLHCLSLDDEAGVSMFARSQHAPDYVELPVLPDFDSEQRAVTAFPGVFALFQRLRRGTTVGRHTDCGLSSFRRPRLTFSRMSEAETVQIKGFGFAL